MKCDTIETYPDSQQRRIRGAEAKVRELKKDRAKIMRDIVNDKPYLEAAAKNAKYIAELEAKLREAGWDALSCREECIKEWEAKLKQGEERIAVLTDQLDIIEAEQVEAGEQED